MSDEFRDEVVTPGQGRETREARAPIVESVKLDDSDRAQAATAVLDQHRDRQQQRVMPASVQAKIDALTKTPAAPVEGQPAAPATPAPSAAPAVAPTSTATAATPASAAAPAADPAADYKVRVTHLETANQRLLAELEAERGKSKSAPAPDKLLADAHESYVEDQLGGLRKFIASSLGITDPNDKAIDAELQDLYTDLTANRLGVTPDPAHEAKREAARARNLFARDKRQRKAEGTTSADQAEAEAEAKKAQAASEFIGSRLQEKRSDGRSLADDHPLLTGLAPLLDGMPPEKLLWQVLQRETKTGRIVLTDDDNANISAAAKLIETHYQGLVDKVAKAKPSTFSSPSTAPPSGTTPPAATTSASPDTRQSPAARTITSADASVAPATPPAPKPDPEKPPKFRSDKDRRAWALRNLPK